MSINVIAHNITAMNTQRSLGISTKSKTASMEKLSSGYRINRAADDAAGLAVSEKMRRLIRGLNQGTENAKDGVSWVQTGDGALDEAQAILHRMTQLTVQSLNGTWTEADRHIMQSEFQQLQLEIDRLTSAATFNEKHIFAEHEIPFYQFEGNICWLPNQKHVITDGENELSITYRMTEYSAPQTVSITVPAGQYTTKELIDEIDTALVNAGLKSQGKGFSLEYTTQGTCNLNLEGGVHIDEVRGGLSYLLYDVYEGGSTGALIGTTIFKDDTKTLPIYAGINDNISFEIESLDGNSTQVDLTIAPGSYTRDELIDILNEELKDTSVEAVKYGNGIKLTSDDSIITALKGNMFKVDYPEKGDRVATSIFYDNIGYEIVSMTESSLMGGGVLTSDYMDIEHSYFHIDASNNTLLVQPNGSASVTSLKISEGYYDAESMSGVLNDLFNDNGLALKAEPYTDKDNYDGLIISSTIKGIESNVGIDPQSSAYNTLFVTRAYNKLEEEEKYERDTRADIDAYYIGGKGFPDEAMPFIVDEGINDKFKLNVDGVSYVITLSEGSYKTVNDITDKINSVIGEIAETLPESEQRTALESIEAKVNSNKIMLLAASNVIRVEALEYEDKAGGVNQGFADIFTTDVTYSMQTAISKDGVVELNTPIDINDFPITIDESNRKLYIYLNDELNKVYLPQKAYNSYDEFLDEINSQLPEYESEEVEITFTNVSGSGTYTIIQIENSGTTTLPSNPIDYESFGSSDLNQGEVGDITNNIAAKITINLANAGPYEITDNNNKLQIEVNGIQKTITLKNGSYSDANNLANMIQEVMDDENTGFGKGLRGVKVSGNANSKNIVISTILVDENGKEQAGDSTNIKCSTDTSSFLFDMNTKRVAASITLTQNLSDKIIIDEDKNDTFIFTYVKGGVEQNVNIQIPPGNYNRSNICDTLTKELKEIGVEVKAEVSGSRMKLTATVPGEGYEIRFDSTNGNAGTSLETLFPNVDTEPKPAIVTIPRDIQESIEIDENSNIFRLSINGNLKEVTLDSKEGGYSRDEFINELNSKLSTLGVSAELDENKIKLTTIATGTDAKIAISYNDGGSAMKKIFGTMEKDNYGLKADFNADNKLELTAIDKSGNTASKEEIIVYSTNGSIFQEPKASSPVVKEGTAYEGYHSTKYSCIDGADLNGSTVTINQWNKDLNFIYYEGYLGRRISISLDEKEYTFDELQEALQNKLDTAINKEGILKVEVSNSGVKIIAGNPGRQYYMLENSFSGGFYYNVLRRTPETRVDTKTQLKEGGYDGLVYAVGRKDIKNNITEISKDVNDTFSLDLTYGDTVHRLSMTLDPGNYNGTSLVNHIQSKLNEQLKSIGLEENTIKVQIGGVNTGVTGNNDNNALVFKLANNVDLPEADVEYKIDGIGGKAAFSVFYQTDGDMKIAYVTGTKNISNGVTIPEESELSFDVDGEHYTISIPAGKYSPERILDRINTELKDVGAPIVAKLSDGYLQLSHTKYGEHRITNISGSAQKYLFFQENGATKGEKDIWIRVGSESGDGVVIERPTINTVSLGINSIVITKPKYAEKALERIKEAVTIVSSVRTMFGSMQNRLEHTINKNENTSENTQAAESVIRDADITKEVLQMSKFNILENVATSMLAQANRSRQDLLSLLQ